jgi:hypothetical protein
MPKVIDRDGFRVYVLNPPREHRPAHVHVQNADAEVLINLPIDGGKLSVRENYGMRAKDVLKAFRLVEENVDALVAEWRRLHG